MRQDTLTATTIVPCPVPLLRARDVTHPDRWLGRGEIVRVARGIYAPAPLWRALTPWDRYLARVHAASLTYPDAVFCHEAGAALRGLPVFGEPAYVHLILAKDATARVVGDVRIHTAVIPRDAPEQNGLLVSAVADIAVDLARSRHPAIGLAVADAALRVDPSLTRETLMGVNEERTSSRGRRLARWPLARATPEAESPFESVSRAAVEWLGFPSPVLQASFVGPHGKEDRVDFWWPDERVAGEADGDLKYDGRFGEPVELLRGRRQRDVRLLEYGIRATAHWAWRDALAGDPLRAALGAAGLRPIRPAEPGQLYGLRRLGAEPHPARLH
ncbi:hypothetical protein ABCS02_19845 [Microbacterium sp. X-17]|uniref:hypothetical protein n=1 Tax=Microbacterium sp. X-17 TaxID=3144404 RepID=UPI0031F55B16